MANNDCQEINDILIETDDKQTEQDISLNLMKDHANRNLWYVNVKCKTGICGFYVEKFSSIKKVFKGLFIGIFKDFLLKDFLFRDFPKVVLSSIQANGLYLLWNTATNAPTG